MRAFTILANSHTDEGTSSFRLPFQIYDAPEVDGQVFVQSQRPLLPGTFIRVHITDATDCDLIGRIEPS